VTAMGRKIEIVPVEEVITELPEGTRPLIDEGLLNCALEVGRLPDGHLCFRHITVEPGKMGSWFPSMSVTRGMSIYLFGSLREKGSDAGDIDLIAMPGGEQELADYEAVADRYSKILDVWLILDRSATCSFGTAREPFGNWRIFSIELEQPGYFAAADLGRETSPEEIADLLGGC
jgi:hypothetical protein